MTIYIIGTIILGIAGVYVLGTMLTGGPGQRVYPAMLPPSPIPPSGVVNVPAGEDIKAGDPIVIRDGKAYRAEKR